VASSSQNARVPFWTVEAMRKKSSPIAECGQVNSGQTKLTFSVHQSRKISRQLFRCQTAGSGSHFIRTGKSGATITNGRLVWIGRSMATQAANCLRQSHLEIEAIPLLEDGLPRKRIPTALSAERSVMFVRVLAIRPPGSRTRTCVVRCHDILGRKLAQKLMFSCEHLLAANSFSSATARK
jgi:hypothetical protein